MKRLLGLVLLSVIVFAAAPAFSGEAMQMWRCEMDDDATEEQVMALAEEWIAAAKKTEGGERLSGFVLFPVAVNATGEMDVMHIVTAPTFEEWGKFWDNYHESPAADVEDKSAEWIICPDSVLWESHSVK